MLKYDLFQFFGDFYFFGRCRRYIGVACSFMFVRDKLNVTNMDDLGGQSLYVLG